ncbi:gamma carbonic anhydrase family protein [Usitatibacter palustris]|uniref:Protein YrdA n=1 Tax=Usitatibacter palustris TaxID=2732487 RepID=A0A6M4HAT5_9PROT|nr:gamma carbonic anhydrase family protein [Usitatibacter palustris]QJR16780.1 Protein YrdA [Usitatibacter palustris]
MIYELGDRKPLFKGDYFVAPNAAVIGSVVFEPGANVWFNVTIRGDNEVITLGENVNVQDGSVIHTDSGVPVVLHRNVSVGHMVMLHGCTIHENSLIGIGAIVLNGAVVGKNCLIGAGALVPEGKTIPDGSLVLGVPGKVVRQLTEQDIATNTWIANHYVERAATYRTALRPIG